MALPKLLWRRVLQATIDTLEGKSIGQYDIRLARPTGIEAFFAGLPRITEGELGGYNVQVPLEAASAPLAVPATSVTVAYIGPGSSRNDWRIPSQRPETAYPLWRAGVGLLPGSKPGEDFVVLIRDPSDRFHARWLRLSELASLPQTLASRLLTDNAGVEELEQAEWEAVGDFFEVVGLGATEPVVELGEHQASAQGLGEPYRYEDENATTSQPDPFTVDPDVLDRGISGHRKTQNALATFLAENDREPRSHRPGVEPPFDLAWGEQSGAICICEVKSLTLANEEKQLRLGLGQLLRYAQQMGVRGHEKVVPVLVAERQPTDASWLDLCASVGVALAWPDELDRLVDGVFA